MKTNPSIIPVIAESERVLSAAIKHFDLKIKPEQLCVTVQSKGRKRAVGWFWAQRWSKAKVKDALHEINLSAELISDHDMGELMLHELAHAENFALDIKDCSGRVHNKHFKSMAERLGLEVKPRDKSVGYGYTDLAQPGKDFLASIKFNKAVFDAHRIAAPKNSPKPGSRMIKCECPTCGYVCRTTRTWLDDVGAPHCPEHGEMGVQS